MGVSRSLGDPVEAFTAFTAGVVVPVVVSAALQVPLAVPDDGAAECFKHRMMNGAGGQYTVQVGQLGTAGGHGDEMMNVEEVGAAAAEEPANGAATLIPC